MFYFTSNVIYLSLLPFIKSQKMQMFTHFAITLFGQSFWVLLLNRTQFIPKSVSVILYFIFVLFLYMFILIGILKLFSLFKPINQTYLITIAFCISFILVLYGHINIYFPKITNYKIESKKNVKTKIAFITDLHFGDLTMKEKTMKKAMEIIKNNNVAFLIIGGDIIEGDISNFKNYSEIFKNSGIKTYAVTGNHDYYGKNYLKEVELLEKDGNIKVLLDSHVDLGNFILIGREDGTHRQRKAVKEIIKDINKDKFLLLVDHNPKFFDEALENNVDLQLSGHTHNGQFFPFNFVVKFIYEKAYGLLKKENGTLITSSGLGAWGPPIKLLSPTEIVIIDIN
jgi:predicted MPP superfamily phosphohydrolase